LLCFPGKVALSKLPKSTVKLCCLKWVNMLFSIMCNQRTFLSHWLLKRICNSIHFATFGDSASFLQLSLPLLVKIKWHNIFFLFFKWQSIKVKADVVPMQIRHIALQTTSVNKYFFFSHHAKKFCTHYVNLHFVTHITLTAFHSISNKSSA
jgi:hypothetical protein